MASTTTFGDFPGVKVTLAGGAIVGVAVGREEKLVGIGVGDSTADAGVNNAVSPISRSDIDTQFGAGTELAEQLKDARANGANIDYLYGVMLDVTSVSAETFAGTASGTLANAPIIEDPSTISVQDTVDATAVTVEFRYDSPPTAPTDADTVHLNPITGEWTADSSSDYEFDYDWPDYSAALDEAETVIETEETGIIAPFAESESISTDLSGRLNALRPNYKMAFGLSAAEPNANTTENEPKYDTSAYTDSIDNDAMFLHAPARKQGSKSTITGAVGGLLAGNAIDDSVFHENLVVDDLEQRLSGAEVEDLEGEQVMPVRQPKSGGTITLENNISTSTATSWERDYWTMRIIDQVTLIAKTIGDSILGRINDTETRSTVESQIRVEMRNLAQDRLIDPVEGEDWFVEVYEVDNNTVGVDLGITPTGIAKQVEFNLTIST